MKLKTRVLCGLTLAAASFITMAASGGCGSNLHKAEVSSGAIAASLHTAADTNHTNTLETADERKLVAGYIKAAAAANDNFLGTLKAAEANGGSVPTSTIVQAFSKLSDEVNALNNEGILKIQSADGQAQFSLLMSSIKAEIATLQALYPANATTAMLRHGSGGGVSGAIALTATEIEELIAMAIAAGSELVPKLMAMRGATGVEIIADAEADDAAAEEVAEEDLGEDAEAEQKPTS